MASNLGKIRRMAFDVGHGKWNTGLPYDPGADYPGPKDEHQAAEEFAEQTAKKIRANGHPTYIIEDVDLHRRVSKAKAWNADYLVSVHFNAGRGSGTEVWVPLYATPSWVKKADLVGRGVATAIGIPFRGVKRTTIFALLRFPRSMILEVCFVDSPGNQDVLKYEASKNKAWVAAARGLLYGIQDL